MKVSFTHNEVTHGFIDIDSLLGPDSEGWFWFIPYKLKWYLFTRVFYKCVVYVQFSKEELAVIHTQKYQNTIVLKRNVDAFLAARTSEKLGGKIYAYTDPEANEYLKGITRLTVKDLMRGPNDYFFDNACDANRYEEDITAQLKVLKDQLDSYAVLNSIDPKSKTVEI